MATQSNPELQGTPDVIKPLTLAQSKRIDSAITSSVVSKDFTKEVSAYIQKLRANLEDIL